MMPLWVKVMFGAFAGGELAQIVIHWPPSGAVALLRMLTPMLWLVAAWFWCAASYGWKDLYMRSLRRGGNTQA